MEQLTAWRKFGYFCGVVMEGTSSIMVALYAGIFLLQVAKLSPYSVSFLFAMERIFDALFSPFLGFLSDNTKVTMFGRRKLWMAIGIVFYCIFFVLLWHVPKDMPQFGSTREIRYTVYYLVIYLIYDFFLEVYKINYDCLLSEMSTEKERISLVSGKIIFHVVSGAMASILLAKYLSFDSVATGDIINLKITVIQAAIIISSVSFPLALFMIRVIQERDAHLTVFDTTRWSDITTPPTITNMQQSVPMVRLSTENGDNVVEDYQSDDMYREEIRIDTWTWRVKTAVRVTWYCITSFLTDCMKLMTDYPYVLLSIVNMLVWIVILVMLMTLALYVKYALGQDNDFFYNIVVRVQSGIISSCVIMILVGKWAQRVDKKTLLILTNIVWAACCMSLVKLKHWDFVDYMFGVCIGMSVALIQAMLPSLVDAAQARNNNRRQDAMYYSFFGVFQKLGTGLSMAAVFGTLGDAGYQSQLTEQPKAVIDMLSELFIILPTCLLLLSIVPLHMYNPPVSIVTHVEASQEF